MTNTMRIDLTITLPDHFFSRVFSLSIVFFSALYPLIELNTGTLFICSTSTRKWMWRFIGIIRSRRRLNGKAELGIPFEVDAEGNTKVDLGATVGLSDTVVSFVGRFCASAWGRSWCCSPSTIQYSFQTHQNLSSAQWKNHRHLRD